jgi:hypothetical protein
MEKAYVCRVNRLTGTNRIAKAIPPSIDWRIDKNLCQIPSPLIVHTLIVNRFGVDGIAAREFDAGLGLCGYHLATPLRPRWSTPRRGYSGHALENPHLAS